jgi:hypothetical protein
MPSRVWMMIAVYTSAFILNSRVGLTLITRRDMGTGTEVNEKRKNRKTPMEYTLT